MVEQIKVKPVGQLIMVAEVEEEESTTTAGIVLPDTVTGNRLRWNKVLAVGDEISVVSPGDLVLVPYDSTGIQIESGDGREYFLIAVTNVLAKATP